MIGGLVGGLVGTLLLIMSVLACLWLHRTRSKRRHGEIPMQNMEAPASVVALARKRPGTWIKPELDGTPISSTSRLVEANGQGHRNHNGQDESLEPRSMFIS